ncbi:NUDIX hydrolase [Corynebacterium flavescens]|uniref:NUDIX hydrolase n=1 Tax=Corynebacterium flavescens TaxID=28028 RepID=UPI003FD46EF7
MQENTENPAEIVVSAVVFRDSAGKVLTVRKRGSMLFQLPGGKPEAGESPRTTAMREVAEEIGVAIPPSSLHPLGKFSAPAANEPRCSVTATVFCHSGSVEPHIDAEIEEMACVNPSHPDRPLAPLLAQKVLPAI